MAFKLVCVHPFHNYVTGQEITNQDEIDKINADERDHNFVRVSIPDPEPVLQEPAPQEPEPVQQADHDAA